MRTRRRQPEISAAARAATLAAIAFAATALILVDPVRGAGDAVVRATATAWRGVFPDRPRPALSQRMIVVLSAPSLADRVAASEEPLAPEEQKRLVADAEAAQQVLLARLRDRGIVLRPEHSFTRTLNGFSANIGPRALAELERARGVTGVYPVRTVYPASLGSDTLSRAEFGPDGGRRPDIGMAAFDGRGTTIALLDTGVDHEHPYLGGRVARGFDVVGGDQLASAEPKPDEPARLESHGTRMAGILVGSGGPEDLRGIAPRARLMPVRVLGWERAADGSYAVMGRADGLIAGLERAVDPDADGDVEDAATVALAAVVEPFAAFSASPEARAVAGATTLGTLVVAAAGNDGRPGDDFGTVGAPGGAPAALTVGVVDSRREVNEVQAMLRAGGETLLDESVRVVGAVAPDTPGELAVTALTGPSLADPARARNAVAGGGALGDFFDPAGVSRVAGRAVLLPAAGGDPDVKVRNAAAAGAAAVLIAGTTLAAGALDLDETGGLPALAVPADVGREALEALASGGGGAITLGAARRVA
ncbi:MAG: S8 family serine peptidase, partial [Actinobacteria bacterium]|nr:S8 family serine peptidase [Actinomycetota bacterium]